MYNPAELKRKTLAHYIELEANPGWRDYAWHQVRCLAKENPSMYWDLPEKLKDAMQKRLYEERQKAGK